MPREQFSAPGSNSWSPYPSPYNAYDGRSAPRTSMGPSSRDYFNGRSRPNSSQPRTQGIVAHAASPSGLTVGQSHYYQVAQHPPSHYLQAPFAESLAYSPSGSSTMGQRAPPGAPPTQISRSQLQVNSTAPTMEPPSQYPQFSQPPSCNHLHAPFADTPAYPPADFSTWTWRQHVPQYFHPYRYSNPGPTIGGFQSQPRLDQPQPLPQNTMDQLHVNGNAPTMGLPSQYNQLTRHSSTMGKHVPQYGGDSIIGNSEILPPPLQDTQLTQNTMTQLQVNSNAPMMGPLLPKPYSQPFPNQTLHFVPSGIDPCYPWERMHQSYPYPNITGYHSTSPSQRLIENIPHMGPIQLLPATTAAAPTINFASSPFTSQWPAEDRAQESVGRPVAAEMRRNLGHQVPSSVSQHGPFEEQPTPPPWLTETSCSNRSFFKGARNFQTGNVQCIDANNVFIHPNVDMIDGWKLLLEKISPNALHDSSARYDAPKCDEDTRLEVTQELMDWIKDRDGPQPLLCMTGAAGSGKSALQQTVAERCAESGILSAALFFSSADTSRNTVSFVVPTIAYQIGLKQDGFRSSVAAIVKHDPYIFSRSLQSQMDALIVRPFESLRRSGQLDVDTFPHVILIDGLDECKGDLVTTSNPGPDDGVNGRRQAEERQAELLAAIKHCILDNSLPFRVFIASRPERAIHTALQPGGYLREVAYHIQLSDQSDATEDMRRYLRRRFEAIGRTIGHSHWFTESEIETLVQAGSGQFVYVATAYKYISEPRTSPEERLRIVLTWTPHEGQIARPFEALDRLYTNILLAAKGAYEAIDTHKGRDFLLLVRFYDRYYGMPANILSVLLDLGARAEEHIFSDLRSIVTIYNKEEEEEEEEEEAQGPNNGDIYLRPYHKSLSDFYREESRAKDLFVPESRVHAHLTKCSMQYIIKCPLDFESLPEDWDEPQDLHWRCMQMAVGDLPSYPCETSIEEEVVDFTEMGGWHKVDKLLPLMFANRIGVFESYVQELRRNRKPDVSAVIGGFAEKWERNGKESTSRDSSQL